MRSSDVLPVPFGPRTASSSFCLELEVEAVPERPLAEVQREAVHRDDRRRHCFSAA